MSSSSILAICSGSIVTTWDCQRLEKENETKSVEELIENGSLFQFEPFGSKYSIADLTWNHNGNVIVSCSGGKSGSEKDVILSNARDGRTLDSFVVESGSSSSGGGCDSLSFEGRGVKSRYLCLTSFRCGQISIWDMKKQSRARKFVLDGVLQAFIDPTDQYVAAISSSSPNLYLYHLRQGKLAKTFQPPPPSSSSTGSKSTCVHCSPIVAEHMAVGTTHGTVHVWDVTSSSTHTTPLATLSGIGGVLTDVKFSPTHAKLLVSASENILSFQDVTLSQTLQSISISPPATTTTTTTTKIAFHPNGQLLAVGTTSGHVTLYDLRQTHTPLHTLSLSSLPIAQLQFSSSIPNTTPAMEKRLPTTKSPILPKPQPPTTTTTTTVHPPPTTNPAITTRTQPTIRNKDTHTTTTTTDISKKSLPHPIQKKTTTTTTTTTTESTKSKSSTPTMNGIENGIEKPIDTYYKGPSPYPIPTTTTIASDSTTEIVKKLFQNQSRPNKEQSSWKNPSIQYNNTKNNNNNKLQMSSPSEKQQLTTSSQENKQSPIHQNHASQQQQQRVSEIMMISKEEIETIVEDCMYDIREDMDRSLRNLHIDILKQFQQQSMEMKNMFTKQQDLLEQILEENKQLRLENNQLRQKLS